MGWFFNRNKPVPTQEELARAADKKDDRKYKVRHAFYDFSKFFVMNFKKWFGKKNDGPEMRTINGLYLERKAEEAKMGGTKPMSYYVDKTGTTWLAKKAVNCLGYYKIEGVLLTESGGKLQQLVDPKTAVDAYIGRTVEDGDVSFQRRVENKVPTKEFDLFFFTKHPDIATKETIQKVEKLGSQILREHVTDWLLCNFDTKGENFIISQKPGEDMVLHGIDKEAAFSKLHSDESMHMSRTYQPHANNTLYNVVFSMYAEGKINLDLKTMTEKVKEIVNMDDDEYMSLYSNFLNHEKQTHPERYGETYTRILERKNELGAEYNKFFTDLVNDRIQNVKTEEAESLKNMYLNDEGKCNLFEEKTKDLAYETDMKLLKLKEQSHGYVYSSDKKEMGIRGLLTAKLIDSKIKELKEVGRFTKGNVDKLFSEEFIKKNVESIKESGVDKKIADAIKTGQIDISEIKSSDEMLKAFKENIARKPAPSDPEMGPERETKMQERNCIEMI